MDTMGTDTLSLPPGTAKLGARNFTLREKTLAPPKVMVQQARREVIEKYGPDHIGKKPSQYTTTNYVEQNKFTARHQEEFLSNTVDRNTFQKVTKPLDHTDVKSSTIKHPPVYLGGPAVSSITFTKEETSSGWNISSEQSYEDFAKAQAKFDQKAIAATMKKSTKLLKEYSSPTDREGAKMEAMRTAKREQLQYRKALELAYGKEGAEQILSAQGKKRTGRATKPSKEDLDAIRKLDDFITYEPTPPPPELNRSEELDDDLEQ